MKHSILYPHSCSSTQLKVAKEPTLTFLYKFRSCSISPRVPKFLPIFSSAQRNKGERGHMQESWKLCFFLPMNVKTQFLGDWFVAEANCHPIEMEICDRHSSCDKAAWASDGVSSSSPFLRSLPPLQKLLPPPDKLQKLRQFLLHHLLT